MNKNSYSKTQKTININVIVTNKNIHFKYLFLLLINNDKHFEIKI